MPIDTRRKPSPHELAQDKQTLNKVFEGLGHRLEFGYYEGTDQFFVKVVNTSTNNVERVIPPKDLLELKQKISESIGKFLDQKL